MSNLNATAVAMPSVTWILGNRLNLLIGPCKDVYGNHLDMTGWNQLLLAAVPPVDTNLNYFVVTFPEFYIGSGGITGKPDGTVLADCTANDSYNFLPETFGNLYLYGEHTPGDGLICLAQTSVSFQL